MGSKTAVLGLDSVPPALLFDKLLDSLPNIKMMYEQGIHGKLRSCDPPITIPAWTVMMTGKNPGDLGMYGFRHRKGNSYNDGYIVDSSHVSARTVWRVLSDHGVKSVVLGVPPSYPVEQIPNANIVSCLLTPSQNRPFTCPPSLKEEVVEVAQGKYVFDVTFRTENRDELKKELFEMTEKRFDVAEYLARAKPWHFFIMHEIGFDRLHHAFWKFFDSHHPKYRRNNPYREIDLEYYSMVDARIGRLVEIFGPECATFVLSDHGSKAMQGGFCVNQWLEKEGYLAFSERPGPQTDLEKAHVDWDRTKAWGWGGYYARIFLNVKGREEKGVVDPGSVASEKRELARRILSIRDNNGRPMNNHVFEPDELYGHAVGDKPDLMVYFDDLNWRSVGTVGHDSLYLSENDTGPDDSVHSMDGIFICYKPGAISGAREVNNLDVHNIAATILAAMGLEPQEEGVPGIPIREVVEAL